MKGGLYRGRKETSGYYAEFGLLAGEIVGCYEYGETYEVFIKLEHTLNNQPIFTSITIEPEHGDVYEIAKQICEDADKLEKKYSKN